MGTRWQLTNALGWQVWGGGEARERGVGWNQMACQAPRYVATNYKEGSLGTQPASNPPTFQSLFPPTVPPTTTPASPGFLKDPSSRLVPAQVSPFLPPKSACLASSPALRPPSGPSLSIPGQVPPHLSVLPSLLATIYCCSALIPQGTVRAAPVSARGLVEEGRRLLRGVPTPQHSPSAPQSAPRRD